MVQLEVQMEDLPLTKITMSNGKVRTTRKGNEETPEAYAHRVFLLAVQEPLAGHLCTTLTGCLPDGQTTIEHCTPYNGSQPSPATIAEHEAVVAALCLEFDCTDCGD